MINFFTDTYDNYLSMSGFNIEQSDPSLKAFSSSSKLYNLIKNNTFFKGKGSCIDLFLSNRKYSFKFSGSYETDISDHHQMIYKMLKSYLKILFKNLIKNCFNNTEPKLLNYRTLGNLSQETFKEDHSKAICDCGNSYDDFNHMFISKLYKHVPKKKKMD